MFKNIDFGKLGYLLGFLLVAVLMECGHMLYTLDRPMPFEGFVNMGISLFAMGLCTALYITLLFDEYAEKTAQIFIMLVIVLYFTFVSVFYASYSEYNPDMAFVSVLLNYLIMFFIMMSVLIFWFYLRDSLKEKPPLMEKLEHVMLALIVINVLLITTNSVTHVFFTVEDNMFVATDYYFVLTVAPFVMACICSYIAHNYISSRRSRLAMHSFVLFPVFASLAELFTSDYDCIPVALLFSSLVIYGNYYVGRGHETIKKDSELSKQRATILVSQIQPHFLYNSLTSIMNIKGNPPEVRDSIANFGRYMRSNLDTITQKYAIPVSREVEHVVTYMELENLSRDMPIDLKLDTDDENFHIPALTLQVIVELAMEYNYTNRSEKGSICIKTEEGDASHLVTVFINESYWDFSELGEIQDLKKFGLTMITKRLAEMVNGTLD